MIKEAVFGVGLKRFMARKGGLNAVPKKTLAEIAGLGLLAGPALAHMAGHETDQDTNHKIELAGLGTLVAPEVHEFLKHYKGHS